LTKFSTKIGISNPTILKYFESEFESKNWEFGTKELDVERLRGRNKV
jgi:hypothetical protein